MEKKLIQNGKHSYLFRAAKNTYIITKMIDKKDGNGKITVAVKMDKLIGDAQDAAVELLIANLNGAPIGDYKIKKFNNNVKVIFLNVEQENIEFTENILMCAILDEEYVQNAA